MWYYGTLTSGLRDHGFVTLLAGFLSHHSDVIGGSRLEVSDGVAVLETALSEGCGIR